LLNVHRRFLTPPCSMMLINLAVICSTLLLGRRLGVNAPAWGLVVGSVLSLLLQFRSVVRLELPSLPSAVPVPFAAVGRAMVPTLIFSALAQNVVIVERWLASTLPAGQISYLVYAGKLMMSPLLVITAAGGLLAFVAMSHASASDDREVFRASLMRSAQVLTILLTASTLFLASLSRPIVLLALQHGRFTAGDVTMTSMLLAIYALGLLPNGLAWLLYRSLQARSRYWQAVLVALIAAVIYLGCALLLFHLWGLRGIAAAFPVSQIASCILLYLCQPDWLRIPASHGLHFARSTTLHFSCIALLLLALQRGVAVLHVGAMAAAMLTLIGGAMIILVGLWFGLPLLRVPEGVRLRPWLESAVARYPRPSRRPDL
jgi:putative peptidoglycan lipid II flippase